MWAYVPSCGAVLADWGASVIKVEPPQGDPVRGMNFANIPPSPGGPFMAELFNRGKQSVCLDLGVDAAHDILMKMVDEADIFLVSLLPATRQRFGIGIEQIQARNPRIIYACGTGQGALGEQTERGGYDAMTFWARGGISDALTPADRALPIPMPTGAFGDSISGLVLAGGIAAAVAHRERTGEALVVEGSLLSTAMWAMQASIVAAGLLNADAPPKINRSFTTNPLVFQYRTSDGRFLALNMLQCDRYWPGFCEAIGRPDMATDPRFSTDHGRAENIEECFRILDETFASKTLAQWCEALDRQPGQWDVLQRPGELRTDPQAVANGFIQSVDCGDGRQLEMIPAPMQFNHQTPTLRGAPRMGADTETVLHRLGLSEAEIAQAKSSGAMG